MKKSLFAGLLIAAIMALSFTGCSSNSDGTAPELEEYFWTEDSKAVSGAKWDDKTAVPRLTEITMENPSTPNDSVTHTFAAVVMFNDPDKDVVKLEISKTEDFAELWDEAEITQEYDGQISWWNGLYITGTQTTTETLYARLVDEKDNYSKTFKYTITLKANQ